MKLYLLQLNRPSSIILPLSSIFCILSPVSCLLYSFVKSHVKNEKNRQIKGKSTKIAAAFIKNKPNFVNFEIGVSSFVTSKYEILPAWRGKKQTQSKPIQTQFKANLRKAKNEHKFYYNNELQKLSPLAGKKTNPIQTQNKFIFQKCSICVPLSQTTSIYKRSEK